MRKAGSSSSLFLIMIVRLDLGADEAERSEMAMRDERVVDINVDVALILSSSSSAFPLPFRLFIISSYAFLISGSTKTRSSNFPPPIETPALNANPPRILNPFLIDLINLFNTDDHDAPLPKANEAKIASTCGPTAVV